MKSFFSKYEEVISITLIIIYLLLNLFIINTFGMMNYISLLLNIFLIIVIIFFISKFNLFKYYGLTSFPNLRKYLYFIPLLIIAFLNFGGGININNSFKEIVIYILFMFCVGFLEEIVFRGFLFKMMEKDNKKTAIIVSSLTFGIGHIINLFNGAELIPTLMQVCYAVSVGFLFIVIFIKSKSLWPCIIAHGLTNSLSIFNINNFFTRYIVPIFIIIISISYSIYIIRNINEDKI